MICAAHGGALLLFTALTLTRALQVAFHPASAVAPDLIDPVYNIWAVAIANHNVTAWPDGLWSLFYGNIYYPTLHAGSYTDVFAGLLPLSLPLGLLIHNPVVLTNVLVALSSVLTAYGAFLLGYELTRTYAAALVAGLVFGFCPLWSEQIGHLNVIGAQWLALGTYCLVRAWRTERGRWWALTGLLFGLTAVTTLYYLAYLSLPLLVAAVSLGRAWTARRLKGALLGSGIAACLVVPFVIPYLTRHATIDAHYGLAGNVDVMSFLQVLRGRPDSWVLPAVSFELTQPNHGLFPGFVPLGLALIAWRYGRARGWALFALACTILALGPSLQIDGHALPVRLPYGWLSTLVPHFNAFRDPARATAGLYLGLAALAAWGMHDVLRRTAGCSRRTVLAALLVGLVALESWSPVPAMTLAAIPRGEYWLARQPEIHVVLELPVTNRTPLDWERQSAIMYDSTVHWKALVNGSASINPAGMAQRQAVLSTYPSAASLRLLRQLRVDAVVLRLGWLSPTQSVAAQAVCHVAYRDRTEEICVGPWADHRHEQRVELSGLRRVFSTAPARFPSGAAPRLQMKPGSRSWL